MKLNYGLFFYCTRPLRSRVSHSYHSYSLKCCWQPLIAPFRINVCKGTRSFSFFHESISACPENWTEVDLWIQNYSNTEVNIPLSWYVIIIYFSSAKLSPHRWMSSQCFREVFLEVTSGFVSEGRNSRQEFFSLHITANVPLKANLPITGRESQLCCVFNLRGPIWRHHRVMRSDTFPALIAVAPVARLPEGCSGQEGHKYFLMSINLITVLCKQGLCYGDRWMYLHFPPQKKTNWRTFLWASLFVSLVTEHA